MNMKLQAEKQAQPLGMRVGIPAARMILPGFIAGARVAARRAQPDFVDRAVGLERVLQPGRDVLVDLALGLEHPAGRPTYRA